jgi:hypothetical protein
MATDRLTETEFSLVLSSIAHKEDAKDRLVCLTQNSCIATPLLLYMNRVDSSEAEDLLLQRLSESG